MGSEKGKLPPFAQVAAIIGFLAVLTILAGTFFLPRYLEYLAGVEHTGFRAVAVTNLDVDEDLDVWTVDGNGVIANVFNDFTKPRLKDIPHELEHIIKGKA